MQILDALPAALAELGAQRLVDAVGTLRETWDETERVHA
jgi:hypothetical protein